MSGENRFYHARGSPREVGLVLGRAVGPRLARYVDRYIEEGPAKRGAVDYASLATGALPWLRRLPERFRYEIEGLAEGAGVPLQKLAEWCYVEEAASGGCTALIARPSGRTWVGRNNDYLAPGLWGYITVREVAGLIPTVSFGMEVEPFTATGLNRERLWLHYNFLPARDAPSHHRPILPPYVWLTTALETCRTISDLEESLRSTDRAGAMLLFAVDGKADGAASGDDGAAAVFECDCSSHVRREPRYACLAGTNHRIADAAVSAASAKRHERVVGLWAGLAGSGAAEDVPTALRRILADSDVEQRDEHFGTVYSVIACPGSGEVWYTFGGYPAASQGHWQRIPWPWDAGGPSPGSLPGSGSVGGRGPVGDCCV